jgi:hypothetical protein
MKRCVGLSDRRDSTRLTPIPQIGLPMDRDKVRKLCLLDAFLTGNGLIVTPWVDLPSRRIPTLDQAHARLFTPASFSSSLTTR